MEKKTVDITEALIYLFKKDNILNMLASLLYFVPIALVMILISLLVYSAEANPFLIFSIIALIILAIPCLILFCGYIPLYQHDRALDKNAVLRNPFTCIIDSFFTYLKATAGGYIINMVLSLLYGIAIIISAICLFIPVVGIVAAILLFVIFTAAYFVLTFLFLFKLIPNFSKDLKFISYLNITEAFKLTKGVRYGYGVIGIYILLSLVFVMIILLSILISGLLIALHVNSFIQALVFGIFSLLFLLCFIYLAFFWASMMGQYTYNAIEQNRGIAPETLPKEINKDTTGIIIAAVVVVLSFIISLVANISSFALQALTAHFENSAAKSKVMKAVRDYENFAAVYMAEKNTKNLSSLTDNNCAEINEYFKVYEQNGCNFKTYDGTYWQFNRDGSAVILDKKDGSTVSVKVGVCDDGTVNCESEYPEVNNFIKSK